jgi:hypothetical protein
LVAQTGVGNGGRKKFYQVRGALSIRKIISSVDRTDLMIWIPGLGKSNLRNSEKT